MIDPGFARVFVSFGPGDPLALALADDSDSAPVFEDQSRTVGRKAGLTLSARFGQEWSDLALRIGLVEIPISTGHATAPDEDVSFGGQSGFGIDFFVGGQARGFTTALNKDISGFVETVTPGHNGAVSTGRGHKDRTLCDESRIEHSRVRLAHDAARKVSKLLTGAYC